jgi:hypothetical protein
MDSATATVPVIATETTGAEVIGEIRIWVTIKFIFKCKARGCSILLPVVTSWVIIVAVIGRTLVSVAAVGLF